MKIPISILLTTHKSKLSIIYQLIFLNKYQYNIFYFLYLATFMI